MSFRFAVLCGALVIAVAPRVLLAQQPTRNWEPRGFDFSPNGAWRQRARNVRAARAAALARGDIAALNAPAANAMAMRGAPALAARTSAMAVDGVLYAPALLVEFENTSTGTLFPASQYQSVLFDAIAPGGRPFTLRTFYEQMSNGMLSVQGQVLGWVTLDSSDTWYEGTCNGLHGRCFNDHMGPLILEAVQKNDATVDFGQFDNDGPDGIPNSGDDDGFVDILVLIQPEVGAECQALVPNVSHNIWSHRYWYNALGQPTPYVTTDDARTGGGFIRINDYMIQPAVGGANACDGNTIMPIGTVAHELGHGFGLPDLYDTNPGDGDDSEGIGEWGLMSSGNYARPLSPAHMEGFSRFQMGWVTMVDLPVDGTYALGPYTVADTIYRIMPNVLNPRTEYFLIENRQGALGDSALINKKGPGLLIYHVDMAKYGGSLVGNYVNSGPVHALWILQADGLNQLRSSTVGIRNRGDAGDPFPGTTNNTMLTYGSNPNLQMNVSKAYPGFVIDSIMLVGAPGGPMSFRLQFLAPLAAADTALRAPVMGATYNDTIVVTGGTGPYTFAVGGGSLPAGLSLSTSGIITGIPLAMGVSTVTVAVSSDVQGVALPLKFTVTAPQLSAQAVGDQLLLGGTHLTQDEQRYMDLTGNGNNAYDVGDVSSWIDRNPSLATPWLRLIARRAR